MCLALFVGIAPTIRRSLDSMVSILLDKTPMLARRRLETRGAIERTEARLGCRLGSSKFVTKLAVPR